jgi:hypothetical protein
MSFRLLHTADLRIDDPLAGIGAAPSHVTERLADAAVDTLDRVVTTALYERLDAVLFAGGLCSSANVGRRTVSRIRDAFATLADAGVAVIAVAGERDRFDVLFEGWTAPPQFTPVGARERRLLRLERDGEPILRVDTASGLDGLAHLVESHATDAPDRTEPGDDEVPLAGDLPLVAVCPLPPRRPGGPPPPSFGRSPACYWALGGRWPPQAVPLPHGAWLVMPGEPQLHGVPPPGTGCGIVLVETDQSADTAADDGGPAKLAPPRWLPAAAVELVSVVVRLADASGVQQLEAHLGAVADSYCAGLPGRLVVLRAIAEGDGAPRPELCDAIERARLVERLNRGRRDRWWADVVVAPLPRPDAQRLMATTAAGAAIAAAASTVRATVPVEALAQAWAPREPRPIPGGPGGPAWNELVTQATSLALDLTRTPDPTHTDGS